MSLRKLATASGLSTTTVHQFETGRVAPIRPQFVPIPQQRYRVHFARGPAAEGVFDRSCGGCHRALGPSGVLGAGRSGPNLSGLLTPFYPHTASGGRAWTEAALAEWLRNPRAVRPATTMPPMAPTAHELRAIAAELGDRAGPLAFY